MKCTKGVANLPFVSTSDPQTRVQDIVDELFASDDESVLAEKYPWLDTSRPNIHDNKKDFEAEKKAVQELEEHLTASIDLLLAGKDKPEEQKAQAARIREAIDLSSLKRIGRTKPKEIEEYICKNMADRGFSICLIWIILQALEEVQKRSRELADQEAEYWTVTNRPPNYYARTIALRLARLYARRKGEKPTIGTARDGGHPSTDYGRALEQIFDTLEIKARVRKPGEWAIGQLTDSDFLATKSQLFRNYLAFQQSDAADRAKGNVLAKWMESDTKGREK